MPWTWDRDVYPYEPHDEEPIVELIDGNQIVMMEPPTENEDDEDDEDDEDEDEDEDEDGYDYENLMISILIDNYTDIIYSSQDGDDFDDDDFEDDDDGFDEPYKSIDPPDYSHYLY